MQIVIDIPDKVYSYIIQECTVLDDGYDSPINHMVHSILHGVILPKGHGRLVDIDNLYAQRIESHNPFFTIPELGEVVSVDDIEKYATTILVSDIGEA